MPDLNNRSQLIFVEDEDGNKQYLDGGGNLFPPGYVPRDEFHRIKAEREAQQMAAKARESRPEDLERDRRQAEARTAILMESECMFPLLNCLAGLEISGHVDLPDIKTFLSKVKTKRAGSDPVLEAYLARHHKKWKSPGSQNVGARANDHVNWLPGGTSAPKSR